MGCGASVRGHSALNEPGARSASAITGHSPVLSDGDWSMTTLVLEVRELIQDLRWRPLFERMRFREMYWRRRKFCVQSNGVKCKTIAPGEVMALVGESGSGKWTCSRPSRPRADFGRDSHRWRGCFGAKLVFVRLYFQDPASLDIIITFEPPHVQAGVRWVAKLLEEEAMALLPKKSA